MMNRPEDWPDRLAAFIEERRNVPFAWGTQDCMLFSADAVLMLRGVDIMAAYRGLYATEAEAEALLNRDGGIDAILATVAEQAGLAERAPKLARRGDLAMVEHGNQLMAGIVTGIHVAVTGADGLAFVSARKIRRAWVV